MCIIGLSCLFVIICNRTSLYLAALAEFPAPAFEGKAVSLWSQNRTLASGTCLWLYTSSTTKVKLGVVSSEPRGSWMLKQVFFCWKIEQRLEMKRSILSMHRAVFNWVSNAIPVIILVFHYSRTRHFLDHCRSRTKAHRVTRTHFPHFIGTIFGCLCSSNSDWYIVFFAPFVISSSAITLEFFVVLVHVLLVLLFFYSQLGAHVSTQTTS